MLNRSRRYRLYRATGGRREVIAGVQLSQSLPQQFPGGPPPPDRIVSKHTFRVVAIWIYINQAPTYSLHYTDANVFPSTRELCFGSKCELFDCRVNTGIQTSTSTLWFDSRHIVCDRRTSEHMRKHDLVKLTNEPLECSEGRCMYYNLGKHVFLDRVDGVVESMKNCSCTKNNITNGIVECYEEKDSKSFSEHRCHGNKSEFCSATFFVKSCQCFEVYDFDKSKRGIYCPRPASFF